MVVLPLLSLSSGWEGDPSRQEEAEGIRQVERERLRSLVEAHLEVARRLHADDFELINPLGTAITKQEYLGRVVWSQASGALRP